MIKALRLSSVCCSSKQIFSLNLQKLIQFSTKTIPTTMAASTTTGGNGENLDGIVKFLELVGNLKVIICECGAASHHQPQPRPLQIL